jgi:hypothetical protein
MRMRSEIWMAGLFLAASEAASAQSTPATLPPDTWLSVPNTHMRDVAPTNGQFAGTWGVDGPTGVIIAWGGGTFDTLRNRLVLFGGGHSDYWGNEVYVFDIGALAWTRLTDPTLNPTLNQDINWDGTPNSRHTYNGLAYIAHADRFFALGGSVAGNGFASCQNTWTFDFGAKVWTNRQPGGTKPTTGYGNACSYDPATKKVWWCENNSQGLFSYDYDSNAWTQHNSDSFYYYTSTIDTKRGVMVIVGNGNVYAYDLANANYTRQTWTTTGGDSLIALANIGLDYDPTLDRIVGWCGGSPYLLDPVSKVWTAGSSVGAPSAGMNGVYGRWRYAPSVNAYVVVTGIDDNVYFYKASGGAGSPLPPPPPAPPPAPSSGTSTSSPTASGGGKKTNRCGCGSIQDEEISRLVWEALALLSLGAVFGRIRPRARA